MRSTIGKAEGEMISRKLEIIHTRTTVITRTAMGTKGTGTIPIIITPTTIIIITVLLTRSPIGIITVTHVIETINTRMPMLIVRRNSKTSIKRLVVK